MKDSADNKTEKQSYPLFDLEPCLKFCESVKALGGSRNSVKKSLLAKEVGLAESTPSFFQKIGSSKTFGIIEGWGSYSLTDIGRSYYYPQSNADKRDSELRLLINPVAFAFLVKRFDGEKLPSNEMIGNILHSELSIPDSWKDRLASLFLKSANFLGIIDSDGYLRYDAAMINDKPTPKEPRTAALSSARDPLDIPAELIAADSAPRGVNVWSFSSKGNQIKVQTPEIISRELWEKLNAYVQILKPEEDESS